MSRNGQEAFKKEKMGSDDEVAENIVPNFKTFSDILRLYTGSRLSSFFPDFVIFF